MAAAEEEENRLLGYSPQQPTNGGADLLACSPQRQPINEGADDASSSKDDDNDEDGHDDAGTSGNDGATDTHNIIVTTTPSGRTVEYTEL